MAKQDQPAGSIWRILSGYMGGSIRKGSRDMAQPASPLKEKKERTGIASKNTKVAQGKSTSVSDKPTPTVGKTGTAFGRNSGGTSRTAASTGAAPSGSVAANGIQKQKEWMWEAYRRQRQEDSMWTAYKQEAQVDVIWAVHDQGEDEERTVQERMENGEYDDLHGTGPDAWDADNDDNDNDATEYESDDEEDNDGTLVDGGTLDNTNLDFSSGTRPISIQLNDQDERRNFLRRSERELLRAYPKEFGRLEEGSRLDDLLAGVFPDGMQKTVYIRNLSFTQDSGYEVRVLGLRPKIYKGDFLSMLLPEGHSLLFKGHIRGKTFVVDGIYETTDTECLDYEVECTVIQREDPQGVVYNFLYDVQNQAQSLARYTEENLVRWQEYLDWKQEVAKRQIYGCKYFQVTVDEEKNRLVFWLVCESEEYFRGFKRYLHGDVQAFEDSYSSDKWVFHLANSDSGDGRKRRFNRSVELGWYGGIVREFYLSVPPAEDTQEQEGAARLDDSAGKWASDAALALSDAELPFENPYVVQVAYELNRTDSDYVLERDLKGEELTQYIYDNVLDKYDQTGFLALSAVGEFVLLRRFQSAIQQLKRNEYYSPNLAAWLFNVSQARLPNPDEHIEVVSWLNPDIQNNENQRVAVQKMLDAPDLCLIQGPPGTGKTTVIAEAIYQFVRRGNRVLIASQSNDAVDNALERLINTPEIRALRLGQKSRKKRNNIASSRFSEDGALQYYYGALSARISEMWLNQWAELDARAARIEKDLRDARFHDKDAANLRDELAQLTEREGSVRSELARRKKELEDAGKTNQRIAEEIAQFAAFRTFAETWEIDEPFFLSEMQIGVMEGALNEAIRRGISVGVFFAPGELDVASMGAQRCNNAILIAGRCAAALRSLVEKAEQADKRKGGNEEERRFLEQRLNEIKDWILQAMDDDDEALERKLKKERRELKLQLDKMGGASSDVEITASEMGFLSKELLNMVNGPNRQRAVDIMTEAANDWKAALEDAIELISAYMASRNPVDTAFIREAMEEAAGRLRVLQEQIEGKRQHLERMDGAIAVLAERYGTAFNDSEALIREIQEAQSVCLTEIADRREFREQWGSALEGFRSRLDNPESAAYDNRFFYDTYLKSCNVVGISCTDNMRELDEAFNGFDVVIVDEVSKATPPELLIPLMKGRKAILVGDHRQLPPMFNEHEGTYREIMERQAEDMDSKEGGDRDDQGGNKALLTPGNFKRFKSMVTASLFKSYFEQADDSIKHSLLVQYRMHSDISSVINRFYDNRLINGCTPEQEAKDKAHAMAIKGLDGLPLIRPERHAYWIDSSNLPSGKPVYESFLGHSTSACNFLELHLIVELLKKMADAHRNAWLKSGGKDTKSVGVISFYQMQVNELRRMWKNVRQKFDFSPLSVEINTVDRFQGKEKNIIIASLVRNNESGKASKHVISFERINVAFSRAQELLVIVGARHMYEGLQVELPNMDRPGHKTVPVYQNIIADLRRKACYKGSEKLITPELEQTILEKCEKERRNRL